MANQPTLDQMSPADRAKRIAVLVANPATRAAIPTKYLPAKYQQGRLTAQRLAAPVVPGSSLTGLDAARQAKAATTVKYGAQDTQLTGLAHDTPSYYQQYVNDLARGSTQQQQIGQSAVDQMKGLQGGITGLSTASAGQLQGQANTDAAGRGATAGDVSGLASNALGIRQALVAALGAGEVGRANANNTYANTRATVVGPGQKLQATVGAQKNLADLKGLEGAYNQSVRDQIKTDEGKNVLAQQALGVTTAKAGADIAATTTRTAKTQADIAYFNKHGYYPRTGPAPTPKGPDTGKVNQYGYSDADWRAMSVAQRQKVIKDFKTTGKTAKPVDPATQYGKDFYAKYGIKPAATAAVGNAKNSIQSAQSLVNQIRKSDPSLTRQQIGQLLLNGQPGSTKKGQESMAIPKVKGLWATVALDLWQYKGKISAGTADKLHRAGYSVKLLGLQTPVTGSSTYVNPPGPAGTGSRGSGSGG